MAKRGGSHHQKRLDQPPVLRLKDRKEKTFLKRVSPGPHPKDRSIALSVLIRDVLGVVSNARQAHRLIRGGKVVVNGRVVKNEKFPVGFADIVEFPEVGTAYLLSVDKKGLLVPVEIKDHAKYGKVMRKYVVKGGKLMAMLHDGENVAVDNHINPGDTLVLDDKKKLLRHLQLKEGATALVIEGKHAGKKVEIVSFKEVGEGKQKEAVLKSGDEEFITLVNYLFVVDDEFRGVVDE